MRVVRNHRRGLIYLFLPGVRLIAALVIGTASYPERPAHRPAWRATVVIRVLAVIRLNLAVIGLVRPSVGLAVLCGRSRGKAGKASHQREFLQFGSAAVRDAHKVQPSPANLRLPGCCVRTPGCAAARDHECQSKNESSLSRLDPTCHGMVAKVALRRLDPPGSIARSHIRKHCPSGTSHAHPPAAGPQVA